MTGRGSFWYYLQQVQLLQLVHVQGLQVQVFVVADMVCSSSEVFASG